MKILELINLKNLQNEKKAVKISLIIIAAIFVFSLGWWILTKPGVKYNFRFENSLNGKVCVENRYLPRKSYPDNVLQYVDELILGPETPRFKLLFSAGTRIESSFVRDGVLYVNLSQEVLDRTGSCSDIKTGIELFKSNVLKTFSKINTVEMYIDNKSVYAYGEGNE